MKLAVELEPPALDPQAIEGGVDRQRDEHPLAGADIARRIQSLFGKDAILKHFDAVIAGVELDQPAPNKGWSTETRFHDRCGTRSALRVDASLLSSAS